MPEAPIIEDLHKIREEIAAESIVAATGGFVPRDGAVSAHGRRAAVGLAEFLPEFQRLEIPLYLCDGTVV